MNNSELLQSIAELLDQKLEEKLEEKLAPIHQRLDSIEDTQNNVILPKLAYIENIQSNEVLPKVKRLRLDMETEALPRLIHIEECYLSTYERYQKGIDQLDAMQANIDTLTLVVTDHSETLQKIS